MLSRLRTHRPFLDVKLIAAHASVVHLPCLQIAYHIASAKWTTISKCFGSNTPVADAKQLSARSAVIYLACPHPARHCPVTKWAYVSEHFAVSLLFSGSFAGCIGLLPSVFFFFAFLVCMRFPAPGPTDEYLISSTQCLLGSYCSPLFKRTRDSKGSESIINRLFSCHVLRHHHTHIHILYIYIYKHLAILFVHCCFEVHQLLTSFDVFAAHFSPYFPFTPSSLLFGPGRVCNQSGLVYRVSGKARARRSTLALVALIAFQYR